MITRTELLAYIETLLEPDRFQDYCPNGLQVAGGEDIHTLITGVTASQALIDAALDYQADTILVHHGYFWRGEDPRLVGIKRQRLQTLLENNINLIAYHLPLDAHPQLGNNAQLVQLLDWQVDGRIAGSGEPALAWHGRLAEPLSLEVFSAKVGQTLQRQPLVIQAHDRLVTTIGWCSGAAQSYIEQAAALGLDAYLSGEISESTVHLARELGISYIAAGHHATERYGVKALGEHLAERFAISQYFVDIDNPV